MVSIMVIGGLAPSIGILGGGEFGGEGVSKGVIENESQMGVGNKRWFKEKAIELKSAGAPLCTRVVNLGVGKYFVVLGLRQGTTSGDRGVTKSFPSGPKPGEENSTRTLPKFRKRETAKTGLSNKWGGEKGAPTEGYGGLPGSVMDASSSEAFPFLSIASRSVSGVAIGSCRWDCVCLPLKDTINRAGSPQRSRHNGVSRCKLAILKSFDNPMHLPI
jgi:hypothetical protein